jgi:RNA-directed DNA polymerase
METTMEELAPYMRGWRSYFGFCETPEVLIYLTRWVRLRLRAAMWRQWKTPRRRLEALSDLGVRPRLARNTAGSGLGPWYRSDPGIHEFLKTVSTVFLTERGEYPAGKRRLV